MSNQAIISKFRKRHDQKQAKNIKTLELSNGSIYKGQILNGVPHGRGTMTYQNSQRYEGQYKNGLKHGKGKYYYLKGELYIGDWFENKKHGKGQYFYTGKKIYTGDFQDNKKHGYGRIDQDDGSYFQGYFNMNDKDKTGVYFNALENKKFMFVFDKGKKISERSVKEIEDSNQVDDVGLPKLLKKDTEKVEEIQIMTVDLNDKGKRINASNFATNIDPISPASKKMQLEEKKVSLIAENYFEHNLLAKNIFDWTSQQVGQWLVQIGFGDCIEQFKQNHIEGDTLLYLTSQDLKQLNVCALGDRNILLREIKFLKLIFKKQCLEISISKFFQHQITFNMVEELEFKKNQKTFIKERVIKEVEVSSSSSSSSSDQELRQEPRKKTKKINNMQNKVYNYIQKKGIKLTFLIPKDQIDITKPIGRGGYGQVFLGRWLGQDVAVKKYLKKQGFRNRHVGHFIEQLQVINKLLHPSIVLYMGMCIYENQYGIVTEFLSGGSLFDLLHKQKRKLEKATIYEIIKDISLGMAYLHGRNVLHCDLKSSNVLIDQNWNFKLCDFGLSRAYSTAQAKKKKKQTIMGTPHWMAPEVLRGQKYQFHSDIYSFGIIIWELLTGQIPYRELSPAQIKGLVGNDENHHISIPNYKDPLFLKVFMNCTQRDPKKRPTFKQVLEMIENEQDNYIVKDK